MTFREAFVVFRATQDWRILVGTVVAAATAAAALGGSSRSILGFVGFYGPPLVAIAVIGGMFEYSRRTAVWVMLAQRPEPDVQRSWAILGFGTVVYVALSLILVGGSLLGVIRNPALAPTAVVSNAIMFLVWIVVAGCAVLLTSATARNGTAAVAIGWMLTPFIFSFLQTGLGFSDRVLYALEFLAPPLNAVFASPSLLRGQPQEQALLRSTQLVVFPLACLLLLRWRLGVLARQDRTRID